MKSTEFQEAKTAAILTVIFSKIWISRSERMVLTYGSAIPVGSWLNSLNSPSNLVVFNVHTFSLLCRAV